jgi:hypothetical protein
MPGSRVGGQGSTLSAPGHGRAASAGEAEEERSLFPCVSNTIRRRLLGRSFASGVVVSGVRLASRVHQRLPSTEVLRDPGGVYSSHESAVALMLGTGLGDRFSGDRTTSARPSEQGRPWTLGRVALHHLVRHGHAGAREGSCGTR